MNRLSYAIGRLQNQRFIQVDGGLFLSFYSPSPATGVDVWLAGRCCMLSCSLCQAGISRPRRACRSRRQRDLLFSLATLPHHPPSPHHNNIPQVPLHHHHACAITGHSYSSLSVCYLLILGPQWAEALNTPPGSDHLSCSRPRARAHHQLHRRTDVDCARRSLLLSPLLLLLLREEGFQTQALKPRCAHTVTTTTTLLYYFTTTTAATATATATASLHVSLPTTRLSSAVRRVILRSSERGRERVPCLLAHLSRLLSVSHTYT